MIREQRVVTVTEATFVRRYGTLSLPSLLVSGGGVEKARIVGAMPKRRLLTELAEFLPAS